jgi:CHAT domain-containing protein
LGVVRWLLDAGQDDSEVKVRRGRVCSIVPKYEGEDELPEARAEQLFLKQRLGAKSIQPKPSVVKKLLVGPAAFDLLHYAGHGEADEEDLEDAQLVLAGRWEEEEGEYITTPLTIPEVQQYARLDDQAGNRPMVVLNACQVGRLGQNVGALRREFGRIGGFARAFLTTGAGVFVSTLWSVGDTPARNFTEGLYTELLAGKTLSEATRAARRRARDAKDATWLAYVVYGSPYAKVVFQRAG